MKNFVAFALFIATASAGLISQPVVSYNSLGLRQVPLVGRVRTLSPVAISSPVVATPILSPVATRQIYSAPVTYSSPVVSSQVLAAPIAYQSSPVVSRVITPVALGQRRLITPL